MIRSLAVLVILSSTAHAEPCNKTKLDALDKALAKARPDDHRFYLIEGLAEACKLPKAVVTAFDRIRGGGGDLYMSAEAKMIADDPALWTASCKGGLRVFSGVGMARSLVREMAARTWSMCDGAAQRLATEPEWLHDKHVALALEIAHVLADSGVDAAHVRSYARGIAELDLPPPPTLASQYPDPGVPAVSGKHVRATRGDYLGEQSAADAATAAIGTIGDRLAGCFAIPGAPGHVVARLTIVDGTPTKGDLIEVTTLSPGSIKIDPARVSDKFRRCVLAHAATAAYAHDVDDLQVSVDLTPI
jgi:hypothetical protein